MFTGIVETTLRVAAVADAPALRRLTLAADWADIRLGESIAINGCCLTVAEILPGQLAFDVIAETLARTNLGALQPGDAVNAERSMKIGDRIDGHFVQGHIDGPTILTEFSADGHDRRLRLEIPFDLAKYIVPKGSVTLDGVSLTVARIDGNFFEVALIPTTLQMTTLGSRALGWRFNLEADVLSKTIVSWLEQRAEARAESSLNAFLITRGTVILTVVCVPAHVDGKPSTSARAQRSATNLIDALPNQKTP